MRLNSGISRQISRMMALVVLGVILLVQLSSYALYAWMLRSAPESLADPADIWPSAEELYWLATTTIISLAVAVIAAGKLSRRILAPLNSVALSLREVAQGNLAALAQSDQHAMGEAAQLVANFNLMAERLQQMEQQRTFWNAAIAHELRTPVTILRGRLQGITDGVFEPDQAQCESLLAHVEGLGRLIDDLRMVALVESGHLALMRVPSDLANEALTVMLLAEPMLRGAGFQPELQLGSEPVICDPIRMRQALLALLENVLKHATPGIVRISSTVTDGSYSLCVDDQGPGIAPSLAEHVFDAFQRGETPHTGVSGSGLGLAVVKAIAIAHGGQAFCRPSTLGGTQFEMRIPHQ